MKHLKVKLPLQCLLLLIFLTPVSAETYKNHFASILVNGKKIGHVQYMEVHNDEGTLQELKTRAAHMRAMRDRLEAGLRKQLGELTVHGQAAEASSRFSPRASRR